MSDDIYAKPDLTKKVRFQTGENEGRNKDVCGNVDNVRIYDNYWAEESTPQDNTTKDQQQTTSVNVCPEKRKLRGAAAVYLGLLCLLLVAVIVLVVTFILERNRLRADNANLTSERDDLQTSFSEMKILNHNLTQKTSQLENENNNITKERDELQKQIETTFCPANWIKFGNSCYLMSTSKKTWTDSRAVCKTHDAQLVIISSKEEQEYISLFNRRTWIGLTDEDIEGYWRWVDGTAVTLKYWRIGQPDNSGPSGRENCAEISTNSGLYNWNDLRCNDKLYFICEKILK